MRNVLIPALAAFSVAASAQQAVLPPLLTTSGNAEVKVDPDMATVTIGVETQDKDAKTAQAKTNVLANRIIAAALKIVEDRKAIQTSNLSLYPEYVNPAPGQPAKIGGYRAGNTVTIRVEDLSKVGPLIDATTLAGATNIQGISFGLKDDLAARKNALKNAVREARAKAEAMAEGLGIKLGDVFSVEEGGGPIVRPYAMEAMAMRMDKAPVEPGQVGLSASVTIRFYIVK